MMNLLGGQFFPAHAVGEVPGSGLRGALIDIAFAQHAEHRLDVGVFGVGIERTNFIRNAGVRIILAVLQANGRYFQFAHGFRRDVETAATAEAAGTASAEATTLRLILIVVVIVSIRIALPRLSQLELARARRRRRPEVAH